MTSYAEFARCIHRQGSTHPDVRGVNRFLRERVGTSQLGGPMFSAQTAASLREYQASAGISPTGAMGLSTWRALGDELGLRRFVELFANRGGSYATLHKMVFGTRYARMFPTKTHDKLVDYAFLVGGGAYGGGGGGLTAAETHDIAKGSRQTDTYFGHGKGIGDIELDIPITLLISEAYKHAMIPEGKTYEEAYKAAYDWIKSNTKEAKQIQAKADKSPKPSPAPVPGQPSRPPAARMESTALVAFGKACHTYMDAHSPAHHGWQKYEMPKKKVKIKVPLVGEADVVVNDYKKFVEEGLAHKDEEAGPPTKEQKDACALYMRAAFYTTFSEEWFHRAVPSETVRETVIAFAKKSKLSGGGARAHHVLDAAGQPPVALPDGVFAAV